MALVLLRLRLTIARRARGRGTGGQAYFAASWVVGIVGGLLFGSGTAALTAAGGRGDLLLLAGFCSIMIPWVLGPILEPTLADGVVDPARLEQFPLSSWSQVTGLLAGALVSPTAAFTFLFAAGAAGVSAETPGARLACLLVAGLFTVMCLSISRVTQALLASALRSRRGTDFAALAAALMVLVAYLFARRAQEAATGLAGQTAVGSLGTLLSWLPPGAAGRAMVSARDGQWLDFALRLTIVGATIGIALAAWAWALSRRVNGTGTIRHDLRRRRPSGALPLMPRLLRVLPSGPTTAAMAQQLRYFFFRSPRAIQALIIPPVMGAVIAYNSFGSSGPEAQVAAFAALSVVAGSFNLFGHDGPGFSYLLQGGAPLRRVQVGKALAPPVYLLPLVLVFSLLQTVGSGVSAVHLVPAVLAGTSVILLGMGIGSVASIYNPSDQSRVGQRRGAFLKTLGWFMLFFALTGLGAIAWLVIAGVAGRAAAGPVMLVVSAAVAWGALAWSGLKLERDPFKILDQLDPRTD